MSRGRPHERPPGVAEASAPETASAPGRRDADRNTGYVERQRGLLDDMLRVTLEQRRCLVNGDVKGLDRTNHRLARLLDHQADLHREHPDLDESPTPEAFAELRRLTQQLREESRTNYLLACRGAQFADFSLSLLHAATPDGETVVDPAASTSIRLVDART